METERDDAKTLRVTAKVLRSVGDGGYVPSVGRLEDRADRLEEIADYLTPRPEPQSEAGVYNGPLHHAERQLNGYLHPEDEELRRERQGEPLLRNALLNVRSALTHRPEPTPEGRTPLSEEAEAARKPLPPESLVGAMNDPAPEETRESRPAETADRPTPETRAGEERRHPCMGSHEAGPCDHPRHDHETGEHVYPPSQPGPEPTPETRPGEEHELAIRLEIMARWMKGVILRGPDPNDPTAYPCHITEQDARDVAAAARRLDAQHDRLQQLEEERARRYAAEEFKDDTGHWKRVGSGPARLDAQEGEEKDGS